MKKEFKKTVLFLSLFFLSLPWISFQATGEMGSVPYSLPLPQVEKLKNGLTVVWYLENHIPVVDLALMVKSGSRDDEWGKSGTAELVSQLLEKGAGALSAKEFSQHIEDLGATSYSQSSDEVMSVGVHGLSQDVAPLLKLLSEMVLHPHFNGEEVKKAQNRLGDYWKHLGDSADQLSGFFFNRVLTQGTPYSRGEMLSVKEMKKIQPQDLVQFHKKHFSPKNSILMVVGRVDRAALSSKIEALFGAWSGGEDLAFRRYETHTFPNYQLKKGEIAVVHRADLPQAQIRMGFRIPSIYSKNRYPLAVGNALLGGYFNSRLNFMVRNQMGLAYGINTSLSYSRDLALFGLSSATQSKNVGHLITLVKKILEETCNGNISTEEVVTAKEYLLGGFPLSVSTLNEIAMRWLDGVIYDLGENYLNEYVSKINLVTPQQVNQAVQEAFQLQNMVIVISGDADQIIPNLKKAGMKKIKRIDSKSLLQAF